MPLSDTVEAARVRLYREGDVFLFDVLKFLLNQCG